MDEGPEEAVIRSSANRSRTPQSTSICISGIAWGVRARRNMAPAASLNQIDA